MKDISKWLIIIGMTTVALGFILNIFSDKLGWLGRLPGDIRLGSKNVRFYFPISTLIIINLVIYLIMRLISWLK
ncbi:MAG: DUF2905 domain-containing protein [Candidatus Neomarinimicrobiota bacterium]|jgi:hypothetical protein|nr:hypothetical protein [Candidatus Neomarinimicrobiota bacterium]MEC7872218.1 DUF2905 domain-containing protein [Candidatus Neomarinimicrobiota bacterium]MEC9007435.1 DUF2905 domain-containing protein [Candidatus Neomarinimicrobiota bacterium]MEC9437180.1 DUF2905 domain-containing protein [Candidatus Neomarinimicrobiota bacterium]MEC9475226.1 DUF2905 domain-containing protein [Candidatus Neomarinimicrobiota bacterium]